MVTNLSIILGLELLNFNDLAIHSHCLYVWVNLVLYKCLSFQGWVSSELCFFFTKLNASMEHHTSMSEQRGQSGQINEVKQSRPRRILRWVTIKQPQVLSAWQKKLKASSIGISK